MESQTHDQVAHHHDVGWQWHQLGAPALGGLRHFAKLAKCLDTVNEPQILMNEPQILFVIPFATSIYNSIRKKVEANAAMPSQFRQAGKGTLTKSDMLKPNGSLFISDEQTGSKTVEIVPVLVRI
jgi:hypothetical protein